MDELLTRQFTALSDVALNAAISQNMCPSMHQKQCRNDYPPCRTDEVLTRQFAALGDEVLAVGSSRPSDSRTIFKHPLRSLAGGDG